MCNEMMNSGIAKKRVQLLSFELCGEEYGVEIGFVKSVDKLEHLTKVQGAPDFIAGLTNKNGKIIPVVNLDRRMGLPVVPYSKETRLLTINIGNLTSGFLVDSVKEIINLPFSSLSKAPAGTNGGRNEFVKFVGNVEGRTIPILNFNKMLSHNFMEHQSED